MVPCRLEPSDSSEMVTQMLFGEVLKIYEEKNLIALLSSEDDISIMIDKDWHALWSLRNENPLEDAETLVLDKNNYILELGKKPKDWYKKSLQANL